MLTMAVVMIIFPHLILIAHAALRIASKALAASFLFNLANFLLAIDVNT